LKAITFEAPAHAAKHHPNPMTQNFGRWKLFRIAAAFSLIFLVGEEAVDLLEGDASFWHVDFSGACRCWVMASANSWKMGLV